MSDIVLDSSVVVKWFIAESDSDKAEKLFVESKSRGDEFLVLDIALSEVANALWKQCRRKLIKPDEATTFLQELLQVPLRIERSENYLHRAMQVAMTYDRSVYDALFVALAESQGLQGVTADEPLYNVTHVDFPQLVLLRNL
jgi:predicted nucleic acid-binding protein